MDRVRIDGEAGTRIAYPWMRRKSKKKGGGRREELEDRVIQGRPYCKNKK